MTSIRGALLADQRLGTTGATILYAIALGYREYGIRTVNGIDYLGATVDVLINAGESIVATRDALRNHLASQMPEVAIYDTYPPTIVPPCIVIEPDHGTYQEVMGVTPHTQHAMTCTAMVRFVSNPAAQDQLDALINST